MLCSLKGLRPQWAVQALRCAQCVFLDVDSTIIKEEGLDELARYLGKYDEVCAITNKAMSGGMPYVEGFEKRMNLLHPTTVELNDFLTVWKPSLTDGVEEFVVSLFQSKKQVYLVSGGISHLVLPVADLLGIPQDHVLCNEIFFTCGNYSGFDRSRPINAPKGKSLEIKSVLSNTGMTRCVMIGDGATDLETKDVVDAFICYTGVRKRTRVAAQSDLCINSFFDLTSILYYVCYTNNELNTLANNFDILVNSI